MEEPRKNSAPRTLGRMEGIKPLCPVCGRELEDGQATPEGWICRCGENIPSALALDPFAGCTHGLNCNCGRGR